VRRDDRRDARSGASLATVVSASDPIPGGFPLMRLAAATLAVLGLALAAVACHAPGSRSGGSQGSGAARAAAGGDPRPRLDDVMQSRFCASCHPAIYAEHMQNPHGLAFVDDEARLATRDFRRENCVRCHTPRPVGETGIGMVPIERHHDLEEGNTCMT